MGKPVTKIRKEKYELWVSTERSIVTTQYPHWEPMIKLLCQLYGIIKWGITGNNPFYEVR